MTTRNALTPLAKALLDLGESEDETRGHLAQWNYSDEIVEASLAEALAFHSFDPLNGSSGSSE